MIQVILNSLISGLLISLAAYSFSIVFKVTRVFHLAQAGLYALAGYGFAALWKYSLLLAVISGIGFTIMVAWLIELFVYRPLFQSGSAQIISLISSIGANVVIINTLAIFFGNSVLTIDTSNLIYFEINGIVLTQIQLIQLIVSIVLLLFIGVLFQILNIDLLVRATANNDYMAGIVGINVPKIRLITMMVGSGLVGIASILSVMDTGIDPYSGVTITLTAAVVAILTGSTKLLPTILVAINVVLIQNLMEWWTSAQLKEGIIFLLLLLVLLWRTEGIVSYKIRTDLK